MHAAARQGVGIDACRGGWCAVAHGPAGVLELGVFACVDEVWENFTDADLLLIDIPIGLSKQGVRECDVLARRMLGRRGASVFTPPCRAALLARTYREASAVNYKRTGRRLSIQCYNILPKIAETDRLLRRTPAARGRLRESHPEVCFAALAGRPMDRPKKDGQGFAQRLSVLQPHVPQAMQIVEQALDRYARRTLSRDDILDALVLAVSAALPAERLASLPAQPPRDSHGLPMEILHPFFAPPRIGRAKKNDCLRHSGMNRAPSFRHVLSRNPVRK
jgi:predicted RNase H-like nuclease